MITVKSKNITTSKFKAVSSNIFKIFFLTLQVIFGYNFGFIKYKSTRHKIIISLSFVILPFVSGIALMVSISPDFYTYSIISFSIHVIECYSYILILVLTSELNTFQTFLDNLLWIDSELKVDNSSYYLELKVVLWCVISILWKIWLRFFTGKPFSSLLAKIFYLIISPPAKVPFVVLFFIFRATHLRLVALKTIINHDPKKAQILYKYLIDSVENVKRPYHFLFFIIYCTNIPTMLMLMYDVVSDVKSKGFLEHFYVNLWMFFATTSFLLSFAAPVLAAGLLPNEAERLNTILQDSLIQENDENKVHDIKRFIKYIKVRPFKIYVLRIIPLDASFIVTSLNFFVTYLIVILQFTHIF